jgi:hypothetical protein
VAQWPLLEELSFLKYQEHDSKVAGAWILHKMWDSTGTDGLPLTRVPDVIQGSVIQDEPAVSLQQLSVGQWHRFERYPAS